MKRILQTLSIALLVPFTGIAQNAVTITGSVTNNDGPAANATVTLSTFSSPALPGEVVAETSTDEFGNYTIQEDFESYYGALELSSSECNYITYLDSMSYPFQENIDIDCSTGSGGGDECEASFILVPDSVEEGIVYFYNASQGSNLSYLWDFGDNTESTDQYPTHTFADEDIEYTVCLTISGDDCNETFCAVVSGQLDGSAAGSGLVGRNGHRSENADQFQAKADGFQFVVIDGSSVLSTDEAFKEIELTIYPNPSNGMVNLKLDLPSRESGTITVTDLTGKKVFQEGAISNENVTLDMTAIPSGIYLVQFKGTESIAVRKIVIQ